MKKNEIATFDLLNTTFIEKNDSATWNHWNNKNFDGIKFSAPSRLEILQLAEGVSPQLIVEKIGADYKIIRSAVNKSFLRGVHFAVNAAHTAVVDFMSDPYHEKLYNGHGRIMNCAEADFEDLLPGQACPRKFSEMLPLVNQYCSTGQITPVELFSAPEIRGLSDKYGVISPTKPGAKNYHGVINSSGCRTPVTGAETSANALIRNLANSGCWLIVEKVARDRYKIVYSDLQKNYLRGQLAVGMILENLYENDTWEEQKLINHVNNELRTLVHSCQREINIPLLPENASVLGTWQLTIPRGYVSLNSDTRRGRAD